MTCSTFILLSDNSQKVPGRCWALQVLCHPKEHQHCTILLQSVIRRTTFYIQNGIPLLIQIDTGWWLQVMPMASCIFKLVLFQWFFWKYNSHIIKFYNLVDSSIFVKLHNHYQYIIPEYFITPKRNLHKHQQLYSFPLHPDPRNQLIYFLSL